MSDKGDFVSPRVAATHTARPSYLSVKNMVAEQATFRNYEMNLEQSQMSNNQKCFTAAPSRAQSQAKGRKLALKSPLNEANKEPKRITPKL